MEVEKSPNGKLNRILKKFTYNNATIAIGLFFVISGLAYYFAWAEYFDAWTDPGLYSLVVVLVAFGIMAVILGETKKRISPEKR
jgi:hypothetical protein